MNTRATQAEPALISDLQKVHKELVSLWRLPSHNPGDGAVIQCGIWDARVEIERLLKVLEVDTETLRSLPKSLQQLYATGRITLGTFEIRNIAAESYETELDNQGVNIGSYARHMLRNKRQFINPVNRSNKKREGKSETMHTVLIRIKDLGFSEEMMWDTNWQKILDKARSFGLEPLPPEAGPSIRLQAKVQAPEDFYSIAMKTIDGPDGLPAIFYHSCDLEGKLWLADDGFNMITPGDEDRLLLFRLRMSEPKES